MAEQITTMLAQPITVGSSLSVSVVDSHSPGGRTVTLTTGVYRILLASAAGSGTDASPIELLSAFETELNAAPGSTLWTVTMTSAARVRIGYGSTGSWSITWTDAALRKVLGFSGTISGSGSGSATATQAPTHCVFSICAANDSGWVDQAQRMAIAEMPDGKTYGWRDSTVRMRRSFDLRFHPTDAATATTLSAAGTQMFPDDYSRWTSPADTVGTDGPWSLKDFFRTAAFKTLGVAVGNFQRIVAGTDTACDQGALTAECLKNERAMARTANGIDQRWDWSGVSLWRRPRVTL